MAAAVSQQLVGLLPCQASNSSLLLIFPYKMKNHLLPLVLLLAVTHASAVAQSRPGVRKPVLTPAAKAKAKNQAAAAAGKGGVKPPPVYAPIVTQATEKVALADKYNAVAGKAAGMGLLEKKDANVQQYVTGKALDGLYFMIGEEEKKIRKDPIGTGSDILKKVFGSLK